MTTTVTPKESYERVKAKALKDYQRGDPLKEIAIRYSRSITAISLWAKQAGLERRQQGCRAKSWPDENDIRVVDAVKAVKNGEPTLEEIGKQFNNMSRAGIHRIYTKWKNWKPHVPFKKGDTVRLDGRDYVVIEPYIFNGKVRDLKTGSVRVLNWTYKFTKTRAVKGKMKEVETSVMAVKLNNDGR